MNKPMLGTLLVAGLTLTPLTACGGGHGKIQAVPTTTATTPTTRTITTSPADKSVRMVAVGVHGITLVTYSFGDETHSFTPNDDTVSSKTFDSDVAPGTHVWIKVKGILNSGIGCGIRVGDLDVDRDVIGPTDTHDSAECEATI